MDDLLKFGAILKKYHFWILVALVVTLSAGLWAKASADLVEQAESRKKALEATNKSLKEITSQSNPSNKEVVDAFKEADEKLKGDVTRAWKFLYSEQKAKNPWPKLNEPFFQYMNTLDMDGDRTPELLLIHRETYGNYVHQQIVPTLSAIIDRRRFKVPPATGLPSAAAPTAAALRGLRGRPVATPAVGGQAPPEWEGKVIWDGADQLINDYTWRDRVPSNVEVRLAQEDFWVYQALLRIIAETNEGVTDYSNAVVKRIENLNIGKKASAAFTSNQTSGPTTTFRTPKDDEDTPAQPTTVVTPDGVRRTQEELNMLALRYLDQNHQPLPAGALGPYPQFNMMPVQMTLIMDQRKIPELLAACGNSKMPVEVDRVTITTLQALPQTTTGPVQSGPNTSRPQGLGGQFRNPDSDDDSGGGGGTWGPTGNTADKDKDLGDDFVKVEVRGLIYIFKSPPDKAHLDSIRRNPSDEDAA